MVAGDMRPIRNLDLGPKLSPYMRGKDIGLLPLAIGYEIRMLRA